MMQQDLKLKMKLAPEMTLSNFDKTFLLIYWTNIFRSLAKILAIAKDLVTK